MCVLNRQSVRAALCLVALFVLSGTPGWAGDIVCEGTYRGHLQGTDAVGTNIWWSFTSKLVRTDLSGKVLASQEAPSHQGDLCVKGDRLYVAVNRGRFNTYTGGVSYVMSYDAMTLAPKKTWKLDMPYGAGGMTWRGDRFYVVGGLPPTDGRNYVHEYDSEFRLVKRHVLETGYTVLGIQTAAFMDGEFLFGIYGGAGNQSGTLRCPPDLSSFRRYVGNGSIGYAKIGGQIYTASTPSVLTTKKNWTGTLHPADGFLDDDKLFSSLWYSKGVPKNGPLRRADISLGTGDGRMKYVTRKEWCAATQKLSDEGFNAVAVDIADGFAYPSHPELAAQGAWNDKQFRVELKRLRELGLEPIPRLDFSAGRFGWTGKKAGTAEGLEIGIGLIKDVLKVFGHPRFFQIVTDGWPSNDCRTLRDAVMANGYGSSPWLLGDSRKMPLLVAHRGAGDIDGRKPEGSKAAYSNAVAMACDVVKLDIQRTRDGVVVMSHDPSLKRTMAWDVNIIDLDYAEIFEKGRFYGPGRKPGGPERIVRLDEALAIVKPIPQFWLDFKYFDPEFAENALRCFADAGIDQSRIMVATFSRPALGYMQEHHPRIRRISHINWRELPEGGFSGGNMKAGNSANREELMQTVLGYCKRFGLYGVNMPEWGTKNEDVAFLHRNGVKWVSFWFVQDADMAWNRSFSGADAYVTDHVSHVRQGLAGVGAGPSVKGND